MREFKPTYLYVKTHNKTGLKYFGKTESKDPYKYKGNGKEWKEHIKQYGDDVTTEIIGFFNDREDCYIHALSFSVANDIVQSPFWANMKLEVLDGGFDFI